MRRADGCLIPTVGPDHVVEEDLRNSLRNVTMRKSPLAPFCQRGEFETAMRERERFLPETAGMTEKRRWRPD
jgi:hypothetical protein